MIVLALDIAAKNSGACFGDGAARPRFRTLKQELYGNDFGVIGTSFRWWMKQIIADCGPGHITFESPWMPMGERATRDRSGLTSTRIPRMLIGLAFLAETIAAENNIPCSEATPETARKHFVGHGRPADPKAEVQLMCRKKGWHISNDHEADAGALWSYTQAMLDRSYVHLPGMPAIGGQNARVSA